MIKGLTGSDGVFVEGGNNSLPYHSPQQGDSFSGVLRLNGSDIQYYNNGYWTNLPTSYATVRMDSGIVSWVRAKQAREQEQHQELEYLKRRAEQHPSLRKAYEAIIRAEERLNADIDKAVADFKLLDKLIGEEDSNAGLEVQMPMSSP